MYFLIFPVYLRLIIKRLATQNHQWTLILFYYYFSLWAKHKFLKSSNRELLSLIKGPRKYQIAYQGRIFLKASTLVSDKNQNNNCYCGYACARKTEKGVQGPASPLHDNVPLCCGYLWEEKPIIKLYLWWQGLHGRSCFPFFRCWCKALGEQQWRIVPSFTGTCQQRPTGEYCHSQDGILKNLSCC